MSNAAAAAAAAAAAVIFAALQSKLAVFAELFGREASLLGL
jgi:hypothetical protein